MTALESVLLLTTIVSSFGESYALVTSRRYVKGTRQRYMWRSYYVTLAWFVIIQCFALALIDVLNDSVVFGGIWAAIGIVRVFQVRINRNSDDDDWWKKRGHKIWAGAKRRIAALLPTPSSPPVTA
jgi:hypothetical protein